MNSQPKVHLFIIWEKARASAEPILQDLALQFTLMDVYEVHWRPQAFSHNLTRLYRTSLPPGCHKERHCGTGPFLVCTVLDTMPQIEERQTPSGPMMRNQRVFDARGRYRKWTGGGHKVHASLDEDETRINLYLLLGKTLQEYSANLPGEWAGSIPPLHADLIGDPSWRCPEELYRALDLGSPYVVLFNSHERIRRGDRTSSGPLVLLARDAWETTHIVNGYPSAADGSGAPYRITVSGCTTPLEVRQVGQGHFDLRWEDHILQHRVHHSSGCWTPAQPDNFWTTTYERLVHHSPAVFPLTAAAANEWEPLNIYLDRHHYQYATPREPGPENSGLRNYLAEQVAHLLRRTRNGG